MLFVQCCRRLRRRLLPLLSPPPYPLPPRALPRQILIRLRQAVDHPYLVIYSATKREGMTPAIAPVPDAPAPNTGNSSVAAGPSARNVSSNGHNVAPSKSANPEVIGDTSSDSEGETPRAGDSVGAGKARGPQPGEDNDDDDWNVCGICSEPVEFPVASECGHEFCRTW